MEIEYYVLPLAIRDVIKGLIEQGASLRDIFGTYEMTTVLDVLGSTNYLGDLAAIDKTSKTLRKLKQISGLDRFSALIRIIEFDLPPEIALSALNMRQSSKNLMYWNNFLREIKNTLQKNNYNWWIDSVQKYNIPAKIKLLQDWIKKHFGQELQIDKIVVMPTRLTLPGSSSVDQQKRIERILHSEENFFDTILGGPADILREKYSRVLSVRLPTWIHQISDLNECQLLGILGHELSHLFFSTVSSLMRENEPCLFGSWAETQEILASFLSLCLLEKAGHSECCKIFLNLEKRVGRQETLKIWPLRKTSLTPNSLLKLIQEKLGGKTYTIHRLEKQLSSLKTRNNKSLKGLLKHLGVDKKGIQLDGMKRSQLIRFAKQKIYVKLEIAAMEMEQAIQHFCSELNVRINNS
ncbi:MAG: hypothetical protein ACFFCZ_26280 [Promethearchaeota archaeon]